MAAVQKAYVMIQTTVIYFCIILPVPHIKTIRHIDATAHVSAAVRVEDILGFCSITVGKAGICDIYHTNLRAASFPALVNSFFWSNKPFIFLFFSFILSFFSLFKSSFYIIMLKTSVIELKTFKNGFTSEFFLVSFDVLLMTL